MSSVVNLALIFNDKNKYSNLDKLCDYFIKNNFTLNKIYIYDESNQKEYNLDNLKNKDLIFSNYNNIQLIKDELKVDICVEIQDDFYGFLISFEENELKNLFLNISDSENYLKNMILDFLKFLDFDYCFLCNDGELEYSYKTLINIHDYKNLYSFLFINKHNERKFYKGKFNIYGV